MVASQIWHEMAWFGQCSSRLHSFCSIAAHVNNCENHDRGYGADAWHCQFHVSIGLWRCQVRALRTTFTSNHTNQLIQTEAKNVHIAAIWVNGSRVESLPSNTHVNDSVLINRNGLHAREIRKVYALRRVLIQNCEGIICVAFVS